MSPKLEWSDFSGWRGLILWHVVLGIRSAVWNGKWEVGHLFPISGTADSYAQSWGECFWGRWCFDGVFMCLCVCVCVLQRSTVISFHKHFKEVCVWGGGLLRDCHSMINLIINPKIQIPKEGLYGGWCVGGRGAINWKLKRKWAELLAWTEMGCSPPWSLRMSAPLGGRVLSWLFWRRNVEWMKRSQSIVGLTRDLIGWFLLHSGKMISHGSEEGRTLCKWFRWFKIIFGWGKMW